MGEGCILAQQIRREVMSEKDNPQAQTPVRLTFKELEWMDYEAGLRARMFGLDYFIVPSTMIDNYRINLANAYNDYAPTIEAAKKIAQDDFERVVRKVITEEPPEPQTREIGIED